MTADPFLQQKINDLKDTPAQRKFRSLCPLPVGVVVWQRVNDDLDALRHEFRTIHDHGIPALKQLVLAGDIAVAQADADVAALEEGVIPWHYGIAGWAPITTELLERLDIDPNLPMPQIQRHPRMVEYQTEFLKERARRLPHKPPPPPGVSMGEPRRYGAAIPDDLVDEFAAWLERSYGTVETLLATYHIPTEQSRATPASFQVVAEMATVSNLGHPRGQGWAGFRQKRDVLRFMADRMVEQIHRVAKDTLSWDPDEPVRTGSHHSLSNQAVSGWDFEAQAQAVAENGSFYSSFHPTHHLTEVDGEMDRPAYMTARVVADSNKGGWSAMWESVGGPQTWSGNHPHTVDGHTLERCMLSYLAAGLKGVGIWCWNPRDKGWEIGEYSLTDFTGKPTSRARAAGAIASACEEYRFELWEAYDQPQVGVLYSWENDAAFARLSYGGYPLPRLEEYSHYPAWARIGAMRALINNCVPFEIVTDRNLKDGLAARYRIIYVPHTICLEEEVVDLLRRYVEAGGRLVVDSPSLLIRADDGTLFNTRQGSPFERMMGLEIANLQSTFNYPLSFRGQPLNGFFSDVNVTTATVMESFPDGRPAVLTHRYGEGSTAFVTFEASSLCHKPGNSAIERFLTELLLDGQPPTYSVDRPILAYRRVAPTADHFFLLNDTDRPQSVHLSVRVQSYKDGVDCVSGEAVDVAGSTLSLPLAPWQGRWVRLTHADGA